METSPQLRPSVSAWRSPLVSLVFSSRCGAAGGSWYPAALDFHPPSCYQAFGPFSKGLTPTPPLPPASPPPTSAVPPTRKHRTRPPSALRHTLNVTQSLTRTSASSDCKLWVGRGQFACPGPHWGPSGQDLHAPGTWLIAFLHEGLERSGAAPTEQQEQLGSQPLFPRW